ncbi:MAG TPA: hypothetical protein PLD59_13825 [Tepidisphaeraceae bacterium]|nr:hypothetical protein [Tepidisphaeraceae bacterium]
MRKVSKLVVLAGAAIAALSAAANAAFVPWTQPSGTVPGLFSYSGGGSDNGLFGNPIISGSTFTFFPSGFLATSSGAVAGSQTTTDRLEFEVDIAPGAIDFASITVRELGDFSVTNGGQVRADAFLFVTNLDNPFGGGSPSSDSDTFTQAFSQPAGGSGDFDLTAASVLPNGWTRLRIVVNNTLQASNDAGGAALIQKKVAGVIVTVNVPEPTTITAAIAGMGALLIRRRSR